MSHHRVTANTSFHHVTANTSYHNVTANISYHNVTANISHHKVTAKTLQYNHQHSVLQCHRQHIVSHCQSQHSVSQCHRQHTVTLSPPTHHTATANTSQCHRQQIVSQSHHQHITMSQRITMPMHLITMPLQTPYHTVTVNTSAGNRSATRLFPEGKTIFDVCRPLIELHYRNCFVAYSSHWFCGSRRLIFGNVCVCVLRD